MKAVEAVSEGQVLKHRRVQSQVVWNRAHYKLFAAALASISLWFIAFRAPLWLDETGSFWIIKDGFLRIWLTESKSINFPAYFSILWLWGKIFGTSEIALRSLSILAMLAAVWLLYLAARELFERDVAIIATVIFCLDPVVIFGSIDVRPYAFAVLATTAGILVLLRLRRSDSNWLAALFGLLSAVIVSFHYLFAVILPAFVVCFFILKAGNRKALWRQFGIAAAVFAVAFLPMIPGIIGLFRTSGTHVYEPSPQFGELIYTIGSKLLLSIFAGAVLAAGLYAAITRKRDSGPVVDSWKILVCASLALIPLLILFGVSVATPIHLFTPRHRLVAVPGIALLWGFLITRYLPRTLRLVFCVSLVGAACYVHYTQPNAKLHKYSWKYAIDFVQQEASSDDAPVVICSDFPEADYVTMPVGSAKSSRYFAQLSYYKLTEPVIPMPRSLNAEAVRVGSQFLQEATEKHERFFALAFRPSYPTLDWLARQAAMNYQVRKLAVLDDIEVLEFRPRIQPRPTSQAR